MSSIGSPRNGGVQRFSSGKRLMNPKLFFWNAIVDWAVQMLSEESIGKIKALFC